MSVSGDSAWNHHDVYDNYCTSGNIAGPREVNEKSRERESERERV